LEEQSQAILPFPIQNAYTRDIRTAAAKAGKPEYLSLWAGQGLSSIRELPAYELVMALSHTT
jgi:nitronate monooxygenase